MQLISSRIQRRLLPYVYLMPFGLLVLCGVTVLWGWETGNVSLVQPRSYDAALPANACIGFILIGLAPLAIGFGWRRTGLALGLLATLLAAATMLQGPLALDLGIDNLLVRHEAVTAGSQVARMPAALAGIFVVTGLLLGWLAARPKDTRRPLLLALLGSLCAAYGLTGLVAYRNGLNTLEAWQTYAGLGPHTAVILVLMGGALIGLAARDDADGADAGPRWLWLPIVVCSATVTCTLWIALRQRELTYTNSTTQLTINNIAALFSGESDAQILSLSRLAKRWTGAGEVSQGGWEADAAEFLRDAEGYQSLQWADATLHTRWYWPHQGNEDAPLFDHASNPVRRAAVEAARRSGSVAIAAPLDSPLQPPSFAIYFPLLRGGNAEGFVVGEFYYDKFFDTIDRRLNLSRRYHLVVTIQHPTAALAKDRELKIYESMTPPEETVDERLRQSAYYNILNQRLTVTLTPRPAFLNANRQYLPEVVLFSGLGVSLLFGLVVNLAQSARRRQLAAERTSDELRTENQARRRVEARLKTADERLNLAFESTQVGVYEWDVETDQVYCTPSIWKIIGYDPAEMPSTGQGWLNLLHADDQPAVRAVIDAHFRGETPLIEIEHCVLHHTGEWLWIALRAKCTSFSATKQPRRVLGTMQNINARKRADEALRASQAESRKLSLVASKTDNSVIITDHEGRIEWVNESYSRLTGRALDEVTGQPLAAALASPESDPEAIGRITAALAGREPITTDAVQLATGDRRFHVHLDVQPVLSDEGTVENFIAIETDITARVETEQQLRRAKADADAASRAKSEFLASMSHEIRTPMNGVIGMTSLMLETELTPEQRDYITTIRTSGDALLTIINEILDFSKIESGKMELDNNPFELTQCVENVIDMFTPQAGAKQIELAYAIDPAVPRCVLGDISRVRQVLVNLMNNAIKFTASGFVTLEVGPGDATVSRPGDKIVIDFCVTDTGIGIPPERLGLLFKPFSQVDSSTTRKYGGTGLGLAICDRLCQLMGGSIDVHSTPGQGSRFHFSIQTSAVDLGDQSMPPSTPLAAGSRVLAVDAHPVNRAMLANCLRSWAVTPVLASGAAEAVAAATGPLSAAIIDQPLPTGAGLDLAAGLRAARPEMPIILLTAAEEGSRPAASDDPLVFHLPKPIKPHLLQELLRRVVVGGGAAPSVETPVAPAATVQLAESIPLDILLVEDNPVNQKVALRYLERMGYQADAVDNGLKAVQAVHARNYHLLFMDVQMPEMDGFTATREIRAQIPPERQPIIVALTANAIQGDRERCLESGMNEYITKPVKIEQIQAVITRFFGSKPG